MQSRRGAKPYPRYDDEIRRLIKIKEAIGLSDSELVRKYKLSDCPSTIRAKLSLSQGCTEKQFKEIERIILEAKQEQIDKLQSITSK